MDCATMSIVLAFDVPPDVVLDEPPVTPPLLTVIDALPVEAMSVWLI